MAALIKEIEAQEHAAGNTGYRFSLNRLSQETGVGYPAVHRWCDEYPVVRRVDLDVLGKFLDHFQVPLEKILTVEVEEVDED